MGIARLFVSSHASWEFRNCPLFPDTLLENDKLNYTKLCVSKIIFLIIREINVWS